ncbi:uncharacterized protein LOC121423050 [Lytechinus variegatus]|uniref:uncharacterized protein LOC121423050 n=1 Tax=Lytechinus variegatus TaxID=7654 RepID=UPI001BB2AFD6|nr:uncharacterized protein LOC121423050 [Lytechinus variegatus]
MMLFQASLSAFVFLFISFHESRAVRRGPYQETSACGYQRVELGPRLSITGGEEAQPGEWPWQVALMYDDSFLCGGQLIKEDWVLTAAHCVTHLNHPTGHTIMMGSIHLNSFAEEEHTQIRRVRDMYPHPRYSTLISDFDLLLLHLEEPFEMTDYVTTICLARAGMGHLYETGTPMWVTGWGAKEDMGSLPQTLHEVQIPMTDHEQCRVMYIGEDEITENMICATPEQGGGKGPCGGDSGGPLVTKVGDQWWLAGTVLGGNGCGSPLFPNVFQNVSQFQQWIEPIFSNRLPESQTTRCGDDEFSCKEGWCIEYWRRCNVREDCLLSTDELYCDHELKLFDVHFHRRLSYKSIIRNYTVPSSVECGKECVRTRRPMKCGAFDTTRGPNNTRICSLGVEAYSIREITREEAEESGVAHFTYRFYPEVGGDTITSHIGLLISPTSTRNSDQLKFVWNLNLDAPNSNTIVFTVQSVKSWTEDCSKLGKRGMLIVKPGGKKRKKNRRGEEPDSINACLSEISKGDVLRFHSLKAKVVFYTTHLRKYAITLEYTTEFNCTKTFTSPGTLKSPKYPEKYPPNLECKWLYRARPGNVINFAVRDFMVEKVPDCEFDYLKIYDGNTTAARNLTSQLCGYTWGEDTITSSSNEMLIVFVADSEVVKTGFHAIVTFQSRSRRRSQRLTAADTIESSAKDSDFMTYFHWGTAGVAFVAITILSIACYMLKKRLNAANALVRNFKRNNVIFDSH